MKGLIVVDLQKGFAPPSMIVAGIKKILPRYDKVVFTRFVNRQKSFFRTELKVFGYARGSKECELVLPLPKRALLIEKPGYGLTSARVKTLRKKCVTALDVCGVDTDACVLGVAYSLWDNGIKPTVLTSLCASRNSLHQAGKKIIARNIQHRSS